MTSTQTTGTQTQTQTQTRTGTIGTNTGTGGTLSACNIIGEQLQKAIKLVSGAVAKKTQLPALECILVSTTSNVDVGNIADTGVSGYIRLTATNWTTYISTTVPAIADAGISLAVPAKRFGATVKPKEATKLTFDTRTRTIEIRQGRNTNQIKGIAGEEFPIIPAADTLPLVAVIPSALLKRAIKEVVPSASTDTARPQLASVYMEICTSGEVLFVAADGYRMALLGGTTSDDGPTPKHIRVMIPAPAFKELDTLLDSPNVNVYLTPDKQHIAFESEAVEVGIRLTDGNYVNFMRVIPQGTPAARFMVPVDDILQVNKAIMPFAEYSANITRWQYSEDGTQYSTLTMSASAAEGAALGRIGAFCKPSEAPKESVNTALNGKYVDTVLKPHKHANVVVELTPQKPVVFRLGDDLMLIIMPMYLPERSITNGN